MKRLLMAGFLMVSSTLLWAQSGEEQAARQARSVHLQYRGWQGPAKIFYLESTPIQLSPGSYFSTIAFNGGYSGIQLLPNGKRIAIFSVWEPGNPLDPKAHPDAVEEAKRTSAHYHGEGVTVQRFGGEGTGGKSTMPLEWQFGQPVYMAISVAQYGEHRTAYTCWIWEEQKQDWFRMATFSTLVNKGSAELTSPYSFLEDFRRNVKSRDEVRTGSVSRLWAWNGSQWSASTDAVFTADNNTLTTIDAGPAADGFWMATGGTTTNVTTKLWSSMKPGGAPDNSAARRMRLVEVVKAAEAVGLTPTTPSAK